MKYLIILSLLIVNINSFQSQTFFQKNDSLSSDFTDRDGDFNQPATNITITETANYLILISAQGSTKALGGNPFSCYQRDGLVKVWSRTRNIELARTPFNHIFADQNSQTVGNPPGLVQKTFPY